MDVRIAAARERLRRALLNGEDTSKHRAALSALEAGEKAKLREVAEQEMSRRQGIADRATTLVAEARASVQGVVDRHPKPERRVCTPSIGA